MSNILMCGNEPLGVLQGNASDISFTPGGGLLSDNVQDAIEEVSLKQGGDINGHLFIDNHDGTTSTAGESVLLVGNNIAEGTDGNSRGRIRLFANTSNNLDIMPPQDMNVSRQVWFPVPSNNNQTLALRSDLPLKCTNINYHNSGSTLNIKVKIDGGFTSYTRKWLMFVTAAGAAPTIQFAHVHTEGGNVPSVSIYTILKSNDNYVYSVSSVALDSNNNMDIVFTRTANTYDSLQVFYTTDLDIEYSL